MSAAYRPVLRGPVLAGLKPERSARAAQAAQPKCVDLLDLDLLWLLAAWAWVRTWVPGHGW